MQDAHGRVVIYEMGSNSLKRHSISDPYDRRARVETVKRKWQVAHRFYAQGPDALDADALAEEVANALCELGADRHLGSDGAQALVLATGVFRELPARARLSERIRESTGLRIRVMSGEDEARLMRSAARSRGLIQPALLADLGGSTLEYAVLDPGPDCRQGSLPLGAIRNACLFAQLDTHSPRYLEQSARHCDAALTAVPRSDTLYAIGGTAKAIAKTLGKSTVSVTELRALIDRIMLEGPPPELEANRQRVLLPGAIILWRLAHHCGADAVRCEGVAIRDGMFRRYARAVALNAAQALTASIILQPTRG